MNAEQKFDILKKADHKLSTGLLIGTMLVDILNQSHEMIQWAYKGEDEKVITLVLDDYRGHEVHLMIDKVDVLDFDVLVLFKVGSPHDRPTLRNEVIDFTMMDLSEGLEGLYYGDSK